jgi:hypothetical protein
VQADNRPPSLLLRCLLLLWLPLWSQLSAADPITQGTPTIAPRGQAGSPDRNNVPPSPPVGCSKDAWLAGRCGNRPPVYPDRDAYRRPVIIQSNPEPVEEAPLTDDWEGCRKAKLSQMNSQQNGDQSRARQLDEWLWKNCRNYSEDLRQLEQDRM